MIKSFDKLVRCPTCGAQPGVACRQRTSHAARRAETLGIERKRRDVTPHPFDYAKDFAARRKAEETVP